MAGITLEEKHFIEDIGLFFEQMGLPRMGGRVLGALLISDPEELSTNDLCDCLRVGKSGVSSIMPFLVGGGLVEKVPPRAPRRDYYRFRPDGWKNFMNQQLVLWKSLHEIAERGLALMKDKDDSLKKRLIDAHDIFSFLEEEMPALYVKWEEARGKLPSGNKVGAKRKGGK